MNPDVGFITFDEFKKSVHISIKDICLDFIGKNRESIKIKKENVILKNMINIVNSTLRLSNEKGFQDLSMRDLSRETGLSMGALYSYFPGKEELLAMIHEQGSETVLKLIMNRINLNIAPLEKLRIFISTHLYISEIMKEWFYFFYMETKNLNKVNQKLPIKIELMTEEICVNILEAGKSQKIFKLENTLFTAAAIKAMLQDWYLKRWKYSMRNISVEEYARFMIEFIESSILRKKKNNFIGGREWKL